MRVRTLKSLAASFVMLSGLGYFLYYVQEQQRVFDEQHASQMKELNQMKAEAKQVKIKINSLGTKEISNEVRKQTLEYIEECTNEGTCLFQVRGEATGSPFVSFIVLDNIWYSLFEEDNITVLRQILKNKVKEVSASPKSYVTIPSDAPFYPIAVENLVNTRSYQVILSYGLSPQGKLLVDETIL
jgi:cell division protein FtsB